jgi:hypothetical protein
MPSKTEPRNVKATTETMVQAATLRSGGATFREIGDALGIDHTWARTLIIRALEAAQYEAADLMRVQEGQRLDRLQRSWWPAALNGDVKAAGIVLRIMDRRARLFGLNAPEQIEVTQVPVEAEAMDAELRVILGRLAEE